MYSERWVLLGLVACAAVSAWGLVGCGAEPAGDGEHLGTVGQPVNLAASRSGMAAAGQDFSCVVLGSGTVKCWGRNDTGQLGQGNVAHRGDAPGELGRGLLPVDLGSGAVVKALDAGASHACALLTTGAVKCWGANASGQLGLGDALPRGDGPSEMGERLLAVNLGSGRSAVAIATGAAHSCAILDTGAVKCWGRNTSGELGQGDTSARGDQAGELGDALLAVNLGSGRTAKAIQAGGAHTCAVLDNNQLKCWGSNLNGVLGLGDSLSRGNKPGDMGEALPAVNLGTGRSAVSLVAGASHTCAILDNGATKCWGRNLNGTLGLGNTASAPALGDAPSEMGNSLMPLDFGTGRRAISLATGKGSTTGHTCARLDNGTLKCWGSNGAGQLGLGNVASYGDDLTEVGDALPVVPLGAGRAAVAIAAGTTHSCALLDTGALKCWGSNAFGEAGLGDTARRGDAPGELGDALPGVDLGLGRVATVALGGPQSCALLDSGALKCWGAGALGGGHGDELAEMGNRLPPLNLGVGRTAVAVSTSTGGGTMFSPVHACVILDNGQLKCWGSNAWGALGQGDTLDRNYGSLPLGFRGDSLPAVNLGSQRTAVAVAAATNYTCAILDNGAVKCWGSGAMLGQGTTFHRGDGLQADGQTEMGDNLPAVNLGSGRRAKQLVAGYAHVCALLDDGRVKCWGSSSVGQLGLGDTVHRGSSPNQMGDNLPAVDLGSDQNQLPLEATALSAGPNHTCALLRSGAVKCWGTGSSGGLGQGDALSRGDNPGEMGNSLLPISLGTGRTATSVSVGGSSCAVLDTGALKCWGSNLTGQLGLGDVQHRGDGPGEMGEQLPALQLGAGRWVRSVALGFLHACAVLDNSAVKCWGLSDYALAGAGAGALGLGDRTARGDGPGEMGDALPAVNLATTSLAVDDDHSCALLEDGSVKCWGNNDFGKLGLGDTRARGDGAGEMGAALPTLDLGTGRTALALATGTSHSCVILDTGAVKCWGRNHLGQLGVGDQTTRGDGPGEMGDALPTVDLGLGRSALAIDLGGDVSCALLDNYQIKCWGDNANGRLGQGNTSARGDAPGEMGEALLPVPFSAERIAKSVSVGSHVCVVTRTNEVRCWGENADGQLGRDHRSALGDQPNELEGLAAVALGSVSGVPRKAAAVSVKGERSCALLTTGDVKCWGKNQFGSLGLGDQSSRGDGLPGGIEMDNQLPLVDLGPGRTATQLSVGGASVCALLNTQELKCWGYNGDAALGQGDRQDRGDVPGEMGAQLLPVWLGSGRTATQVASSSRHTCAALDSGQLKCWGSSRYGQLGLGDVATRGDTAGEMGDALPALKL